MLASTSKPITATALMTLVEDGKVVLSSPIARYVPEFDAPGKARVKVWHLLTHTSGLVHEWPDWETYRRDRVTAQDVLRAACSTHLSYEPGTRFHYYTDGFYILAEAISRLSGASYPDYMRGRVFEPLGMPDTCFDPWAEGKGERAVVPVGVTDDGATGAEEVMRYFTTMRHPGIGVWSTIIELVALGQALLNGGAGTNGHRLLSPATVELMSRDHTAGLYKTEEDHRTPVHYGLTWRKGTLDGYPTLPGSPRVIEHDGAFGTWLWIDPEWDLVFALLTNQWQKEFHAQPAALAAVYSSLHRA